MLDEQVEIGWHNTMVTVRNQERMLRGRVIISSGTWIAVAEGTKVGRMTLSLPAMGVILCITAPWGL